MEQWAPLRAEQSCPDYGWCAPPEAGRTSGAPLHHPAHLPPQEAELAELASRALRVLLGSDSVLLHAQLRLAVLGRGEAADGAAASRSKCLLELAVAGLVEQGLVVRQGYGPFANLSVPDVALPKAEALAYSEFPDEGHLANLHSGRGGGGAPHHRLLASAHRPASCLTRLRRHSSPRQFSGRMSGIEKAAGRRSKRSVGDDLSSQMAKKMRMGENGGGGGNAALSSSPFSGGCMAMSP